MKNKVQMNGSGLVSNGCQEQGSEIYPVEGGTMKRKVDGAQSTREGCAR